jgi:electron transport complex protein RnfC
VADVEKQATMHASIEQAKTSKAGSANAPVSDINAKPVADLEKQAKIDAAIARAKAQKAAALNAKENQSKE